jgi:hypothetical protein
LSSLKRFFENLENKLKELKLDSGIDPEDYKNLLKNL